MPSEVTRRGFLGTAGTADACLDRRGMAEIPTEKRITAMRTAILCIGVMAASTTFALDFDAPVEKLASDFKFTEGPIWVAAKNELLFSDIPANRIVRFKDGKCETFRTPSNNSNGLTLDKQGRLIACEHGSRRVTRTEADGTITVLAERSKASASTARTTWSSRATAPSISPIHLRRQTRRAGTGFPRRVPDFPRQQDVNGGRQGFPYAQRARVHARRKDSLHQRHRHGHIRVFDVPPMAHSPTAVSSPTGLPAPMA